MGQNDRTRNIFWPFVYTSTWYVAIVATIQSIFGRGVAKIVDPDKIPGFPQATN